MFTPHLSGGNSTVMQLLDMMHRGDDDDNHTWEYAGIKVGHLGKEHHPELTMVQTSDLDSWIIFFLLFVVLIIFDNFVLHRTHEEISFARASCYTVFWLCCAAAFMVYVNFARSTEDAIDWGTGYLLEWMLSVDNLFVFRTIFVAFKTPETQKHKPLFWGIMGAVVFRMAFFAIGEFLLHFFWWMTYVLGAFLIYTGVKLLLFDDEDADIEDNWVLQQVSRFVPFVNKYATTPKFFARIADDAPGTPRQLAQTPKLRGESAAEEYHLDEDVEDGHPYIGQEIDTAREDAPPLRATRLTMVVIVLEVTDVIFAVDSVSAIVAQIPDLFLAYTACVFAMLGLRATFFVVDELVKLFSLLGYAISAMLIFIGLKLCLKSYVHFPPQIVCSILVLTLVASMVGSVIMGRFGKGSESESEGQDEKQAKPAQEQKADEQETDKKKPGTSQRSAPEDTSNGSALS